MESSQERMMVLLQHGGEHDLVTTSSWFKQLVEVINDLINDDFAWLVSVLYQADVSEEKLKTVLQQNPGVNAAELVAGLLLERQLQKIKSRKDFKSSGLNLEEDEKW